MDMGSKITVRTLLAFLFAMCLTSCEKDENGYYLSSNYCTATINGEEYIHRESYAFPMDGHFPSAELYDGDYFVGDEAIDIMPVMIIKAFYLTPCKSSAGSPQYGFKLYMKSFDTSRWYGKTYTFTATPLENLFGSSTVPFERMWKEDINIAIIERVVGDESTRYTASGKITFRNYNKEDGYFEADVVLNVEGDQPISLQGYIYAQL